LKSAGVDINKITAKRGALWLKKLNQKKRRAAKLRQEAKSNKKSKKANPVICEGSQGSLT
jgi:hypothetical protein